MSGLDKYKVPFRREIAEYFKNGQFCLDEANFYYDYYINNLRILSRVPGLSLEFIKMDSADVSIAYDGRIIMSNPYLENGIYEFGKELDEIGTYWVFMTDKLGRVQEGFHRAFALKAIHSDCSKLSLRFNANMDENVEGLRLYMLFPPDYVSVLRQAGLFSDIIKVENDLYVARVDNYYDIRTLMCSYSFLLDKMIQPFRGDFIPAKIINDSVEFFKWAGCTSAGNLKK